MVINKIDNQLFPGSFATVNGNRMHYLDEGPTKGSLGTVLMLHGNPSWSFYYRNLAAQLKDRYRVIVPDHIGCGLSEKPSEDKYNYRLEQRVTDIETLIEQIAPEGPLTLVVHDWGGMIGTTFATRHPERIERIVVLNTGAFRLPKSKPLPLGLRIGRDSILGKILIRGFNSFARGAAWVGCKRNKMPKVLRDAYCAPYNSWANRVATHLFVKDIPLHKGDPGYDIVCDVEEKLAQFTSIPMMIAWGELDFVFDLHFLAEWERRFPNAEVHRFPDCGHYILEDAADEVIALIDNFLSKTQAQV